ncbi:hypothetical protein [Persephonella sp. KM09-Lau-8]|uniref:hypothetical protein n=1 Tax=Persephonella sp. KM09-Lau-8 TaxID=1158345 RepID=UPI000497B54D|nr:hypothetical protein [Persephonella sp. KM09-Lau-8]
MTKRERDLDDIERYLRLYFEGYKPRKHSRGKLSFYEEQNYDLLSALRFLYDLTEGGETLIRTYFNLDTYFFFKYISSPFLSKRIYNKLKEGADRMESSCIGTRRAMAKVIKKILKTKRIASSSFIE